MTTTERRPAGLDPLLPHRLDVQAAVLRTLANRLDHELEVHELHDAESITYQSETDGIRFASDGSVWPLVYSDDDYLVVRRHGTSLCVFERMVRDDGGGLIRKLFEFHA